MAVNPETEAIATQIRTALDGADLTAFAELLDPRVTWGAPGDPTPSCQNRAQVLHWYQQGRAQGRRARVLDITTNADKILVSLKITDQNPTATAAETDRWQVLTVQAGRVIDIRGYDNPHDARTATGLPI